MKVFHGSLMGLLLFFFESALRVLPGISESVGEQGDLLFVGDPLLWETRDMGDPSEGFATGL